MRDILVLAIIFGSLPLIFFRPWLGILIWYWVGLMSPHRLAWGIALQFPVAQVVAVAALIGLLLAKDRKTIPLTRETFLLALFAAHITLTTSLAWAPTAWQQWDMVMKILLMTFVTPILIFGRERIMLLVLVVVLSLGFYGLKGGIFSIVTGGSYRVWGPFGTFIGGNTNLGMGLTMTLPLMLVIARAVREGGIGIAMVERFRIPLGYFFFAIFVFSIIAIIFTYSRGAWVALAVVAPLIFLKMRRRLLLLATFIVFGGSLVALFPESVVDRAETIANYQQDYSAMTRIQAWGVNWNMALERPLVGVGFNNPDIGDALWLSYANWVEPWAVTARAAHSVFFQVIGHHGFLGAGIYFSMLAFTMLTLVRLYRQAGRGNSTVWMRDLAWGLLVGMVGFFAAGAFLDMAYFTLVYVFVALTVILGREFEQVSQRERQPAEQAELPPRSPTRPAFPDFVASKRR
jgi:putative inorganic carbon (hco3(-)) transporter